MDMMPEGRVDLERLRNTEKIQRERRTNWYNQIYAAKQSQELTMN